MSFQWLRERLHTNWIFEMKHARRLSKCMIDSYSYTIRVFFEWLNQTGRAGDAEVDLRAFFEALVQRYENPPSDAHVSKKKPGSRMCHAHFVNLRVMFNWGVKRRYISHSPLDQIPAPRHKEAKALLF
jgi:site-specific recombinase XerD